MTKFDKTANIYRTARQAAGLTQERWAEMLGVSTEAVRQYEGGVYVPADEIARRMAEISGMPVLGYWHLCRKSRLAADLLPQVEPVPLAQAVCALLAGMDRFNRSSRAADLLKIAADGKVDELEKEDFRQIQTDLEEIIQAALSVKYAQKEEEEQNGMD